MSEPQEKSGIGIYDLAHGTIVRYFTVQGNERVYFGTEGGADSFVDELENSGLPYVLEETMVTSVPTSERPQLRKPMTPVELQSTKIEARHFHGLSKLQISLLRGPLYTSGVRSFADVLALGSDAIHEQTKAIDQPVANKLKKYLEAAVLIHTGHALPEGRATPEEQLGYFDDIREASCALAVPFEGIRNFIYMHFAINRTTIGDVIAVLDDDAQKGLQLRPVDIEFACTLKDRIVEPFELARAAAAAGGLATSEEG